MCPGPYGHSFEREGERVALSYLALDSPLHLVLTGVRSIVTAESNPGPDLKGLTSLEWTEFQVQGRGAKVQLSSTDVGCGSGLEPDRGGGIKTTRRNDERKHFWCPDI